MTDMQTLAHTVDRLAFVKAQIADLQTESDNLKAALVASGMAAIDSTLYRATVSESAGRTNVDWRAIAEKLQPSRQLVTAHTSVGDAFFTVRVFARKTS